MVRLTVPVWNVLVSDTRSDIEHDDTALSIDVVSVTKTTKLLLSSGIPDIELDSTQVLFKLVLLVSSAGLNVRL